MSGDAVERAMRISRASRKQVEACMRGERTMLGPRTERIIRSCFDETPEPDPEVEPASPALEAFALEDLRKADLQDLCDEKGIEYTSRATKADLIALLEG